MINDFMNLFSLVNYELFTLDSELYLINYFFFMLFKI